MKKILKNSQIRFGSGGIISKDFVDDAADPAGYIKHQHEKAFLVLGETIGRDKSGVIEERKLPNGDREFRAEVYVFTLEELKELASALRAVPGDIFIDGEKL